MVVAEVVKKIDWKSTGKTVAKLMLATLAGFAAEAATKKAFDSVVKTDSDITTES